MKEFAKLPKNSKYVIESSSVWYKTFLLLRDRMKLDVVLSNPRATKIIAASKKKTDKVDARILADLLRGNYIAASYVPPDDIMSNRQLVRYRNKLVQERARFKNMVHAILLQNMIKIEGAKFSTEFKKELKKLNDWRIDGYVRTIEFLDKEIAKSDSMIAKEVSKSKQTMLLKTIPGVGDITALTVMSEIDDISRFSSMDKLAAYFGIVPSVRNSASTTHHGSITRTGNSMVRKLLTEAVLVHVMIMNKKETSTLLTIFYKRLSDKRGHSKAKVAAAAKLLKIMYWMLKKEIDFNTCVREGEKAKKAHLKRHERRSDKVKHYG